ncbi:MAG: hypothetical protein AB7G37_11275 [Solirubrobacteraceae bacterium]
MSLRAVDAVTDRIRSSADVGAVHLVALEGSTAVVLVQCEDRTTLEGALLEALAPDLVGCTEAGGRLEVTLRGPAGRR